MSLFAVLMSGTAAGGGLTVTVSQTSLSANTSNTTAKSPGISTKIEGYDTPLSENPLTYEWTVTMDEGSGLISALNPTGSTSGFLANGMVHGETRSGTAYCTVTQPSSGKSGRSADISITFTRGG